MKTLRLLPVWVLPCLLAVAFAPVLRATVPNQWLGTAATGDVTDSANWTTTLAGDGSDNVAFGDVVGGHSNVQVTGNGIKLNNVTFNGSARPAYSFEAANPYALELGAGVYLGSGSDVNFTNNVGLILSNTQHTVDVASGVTLTVDGVISGTGLSSSLLKTNSGTLVLKGANTFSAGVQLDGGWLLVGNDSALGSGMLTLNGGTLAPAYTGSTTTFTLANNITINSGTKLADCDTVNGVTFNGVIAGTGAFDAHGYGDLRFNGNNVSWSGGIAFYGANNVYVGNAKGLGTGNVTFDSSSDTILHINSGIAAAIGNLSGGDYEYDASIALGNTASLTINQTNSATYGGSITGYNDGTTDGGLIKKGNGALTLTGVGSYYGPTVIEAGVLIADGSNNDHQLGYGAVTVKTGATLQLADTYLYNSTVTVESGGKLTGYGQIGNGYNGYATTINGGATLAPGIAGTSPIGQLAFDHLTMLSNSIYEWNLKSPTGLAGTDWDLASITAYSSTLHIDSTLANPITLKLISVTGSRTVGPATGFVFQNYQWKIFDGGNTPIAYASGAFDPGLFTIDSTAFSTDIGTGSGNFSLTADQYAIYLNFTPVPEPSTYALMALGLLTTGVAAWRRRRA